MTPTTENSDAELVSESLAGNRESFGRIVEQYQSLVCSIAYSATGSLSESEDLAQETFVIAWKELRQLREPKKLRPWLCSIARSVVSGAARRQRREPAHSAEPMDNALGAFASEPLPSESAINREEEAILWRAIERIPETYREPLILFYREDESVARVAQRLGLSEEAARQRLSRGRKLLTDEVAAHVERILKQTTPRKAFTMGVLAALPTAKISASAASVAATAGKSMASLKVAASTGLAGVVFGPLLGILGGILGGLAGIWGSVHNTESPRERQLVKKVMWILFAVTQVVVLAILAIGFATRAWWRVHPLAGTLAVIGVMLGLGAAATIFALWSNRVQRRIRAEEWAKLPPGTLPPSRTEFFAPFKVVSREYRSRWTLLGLPLIHIRLGIRHDGRLLPAKGWIAVGEKAYGALFAFGSAYAVAPISLAGGVAFGVLAVGGGAAAGILPIAGGFAFGLWASAGGLAAGVLASAGGCAIGWTAADAGGQALAREFAVASGAIASHSNDVAARAAINNNVFFSCLNLETWIAGLLLLLSYGGIIWWVSRKAPSELPPGSHN